MRILTYDDFQKGLLYEDYADYVDYDRGVVVKNEKIVEKNNNYDDSKDLKAENKELKKVCFALTVFSLFLVFCFFVTR
ncbi:hypothetical protein HMPREF3188_00066 [Tissierellia bacterium KA00581]|nr:hypothetical protein HMPREF3188_00066 [Tissierellia bacterium KA00581]